jgi:predicted KAP-like P-loop ATPase
MTIIRPNTKPPLWWLFPWSYAQTLHMAANALKALCDRQDDALTLQAHIISDQSEEIHFLRQRLDDLNDAIIRGSAITPDAGPIPEDSES